MGVLILDRVATIDLDDRLLEHAFAVIVVKFRRHEPVVLSWRGPDGQPQLAFMHPASTIRAEYGGAGRRALERNLLERMMLAANSNAGLALDDLGHADLPVMVRSAPHSGPFRPAEPARA